MPSAPCKLNTDLNSAESTRIWKFLWQDGIWCFKKKEKNGLCFFLAFWLFSSSLLPLFWVQWHSATTLLRTGVGQDRDRGDNALTVPWSTLMRRAVFSWAGWSDQHVENMGHLLMSLSSQPWLCSKGPTRLLLHSALMEFTVTAEQKPRFHEVIAHCQESFYWAHLQLSSDICDELCILVVLPSSPIGHYCLQSCTSAESPEIFN